MQTSLQCVFFHGGLAHTTGCGRPSRVGMVLVFNFLIPVFGVLLSALLQGEQIPAWRNVVVPLLVCGGIWLVSAAPRVAPRPA